VEKHRKSIIVSQKCNGNGLLFHMSQSTSRRTTKNHCTKQTNH